MLICYAWIHTKNLKIKNTHNQSFYSLCTLLIHQNRNPVGRRSARHCKKKKERINLDEEKEKEKEKKTQMCSYQMCCYQTEA